MKNLRWAIQLAKRLFSDGKGQGIIGVIFTAFFLRLFGAFLGFSFSVLVARLLGIEGAGIYFLCLSIVIVGGDIGRAGLDNILMRNIAVHASQNNWSEVKGTNLVGIHITFVIAGVVSCLLYIFSPWLASEVFQNRELGQPLQWMSLSVLPMALLNSQAQSLKGLKRIKNSMFLQGIGVPLLSLIFLFPFVSICGINGAAMAYVFSACLISIAGWWAWRKAVINYSSSLPSADFNQILKSCWPLFIAGIFWTLQMQMPTIVLGLNASSEEVAVFATSNRIAAILNMLLAAASSAVAPNFSELFSQKEIDLLRTLAKRTTFYISVMAMPIFLVLLVFGDVVMSVFGSQFVSGGHVLSILLVGQLFNVVSGMVAIMVLIASGNELAFRNIVISAVLIQLMLSTVLDPAYGAIGAAIAVSASLLWLNFWVNWAIWKQMNFIVLPSLGK